MQVELFKYYIRKFNAGTLVWEYYYVDTAGVVQITTTKTELPQAPKGWEGQTLKWERGFTYYGVFTNYSNPLQFVKDGAIIVKYLYYTFGIEAVAELLIDKHTETVATWGYAEYYRGDLDFSQFKDMKDYCQLSIMDNGFMAKLKAKEDTTKEIEIEQNAAVQWVMMDGIDLQALTKWAGVYNEVGTGNGNDTVMTLANYLTTGTNLNMVFQTQFLIPGSTYAMAKNASDVSQDVDITYNYSYFAQNNVGSPAGGYFTILFFVLDANNFITNTILVYQDAVMLPIGGSATYTGTATNTITLAPGEQLTSTIRLYTTPGIGGAILIPINYIIVDQNTVIDLELLNRVPTTYIPCIPATTVGDALVANIDPNATYNGVTGTDYPDYYLTSGDALRNLSNSVLKTSWADFYKSQDCMFNTAFKFDRSTNTATIDYKYTAFDPTTATMDLGEINKFEVGPLTAEMFARLKMGYKPYSYDEINGKEEFNTEVQFQTPMTRVVGEKDLISPYRADMYGIELTRANLTNKVEADKDMDNDVFWLHLDPSIVGTVPSGPGVGQQYYGLRRDPGLTITNMISPSTVFNVDFSPKRRLFAHGYWVRSFMYPNTSGSIEFNTSFKTQNGALGMVTDDGVTIITEKASETIGSLPGTGETPNRNTIFYPLVFTVETKIPLNVMDLMTDPYCEFTFTYLGNTYYGWLLEVSDEPSHTPKQVYKLIASPSNTLTTLINGL